MEGVGESGERELLDPSLLPTSLNVNIYGMFVKKFKIWTLVTTDLTFEQKFGYTEIDNCLQAVIIQKHKK